MPYRLRLHFEHTEAFQQAFERNAAMGGAFVATGDPVQLHSVVEVEVTVADRREGLRLQAQVVHVVPPERALQPLEAGVVVAFLDPADELREKLAPFLAAAEARPAAEAVPTPDPEAVAPDAASPAGGSPEVPQPGADPAGPSPAFRYPPDARFEPRMHFVDSERLSPLEASLVELATVGLPASRMLEVIPEEAGEIQHALQDLVDRGVLCPT